MPSKLAFLIASREGFFRSGTLPARQHNPGDLRHSPHSEHPGDPNGIGVIDTDADGWEDLERQLVLYSRRLISIDPVTGAVVHIHKMNLRDAIYAWAPPSENDTAAYLDFVVDGFGGEVDPGTPLVSVLLIPQKL